MRFAQLDRDGWQLQGASGLPAIGAAMNPSLVPVGSLCRLMFEIGFADTVGQTSVHCQPLWVSVRSTLPQSAYLGCLVEAPFLFCDPMDDDLRPGLDLPFALDHILDLVLPQDIAPAEQALIASLPRLAWLPRAA